MIKIASNRSRVAAQRTPSQWPHSATRFMWQRLWRIGSIRHRVQTASRSRVWTIWQQGSYVFAGSKQQCEDWLDWQDQQIRKNVQSK